MKTLITFILIAFAPLFSLGQAYTPLGLDTSCFWVQQYFVSYPGQSFAVNALVQNYVEKDTLIGTYTFHKIRGYSIESVPIDQWHSSNDIQLIMDYRCYNPILFLREDTVLKKLFRFDPDIGLEYEYLSFDLQLGDTTSYTSDTIYSSSAPYFIIDSIDMASYYGITSRTYFSTFYDRIEGIGAIANFPLDWRIEFGSPVFQTHYYVKNGNVIYKDQAYMASQCVWRSKAYNPCSWATSTTVFEKKKLIKYSNNNLSIETPGKFTISLYTSVGSLIDRKESKETYNKDLSIYPLGIYILSLQSSKGIENRKILIR